MSDVELFLARQAEVIDRVGWLVLHVFPEADDPPDVAAFAYTVGLSARGHPELLATGLPPQAGHGLLNELAGRVHADARRFQHGELVSNPAGDQAVVIIDAQPSGEIFPALAFKRYGPARVRVQQVLWPDEQGRFPGERGYAVERFPQPLLGTPTWRRHA